MDELKQKYLKWGIIGLGALMLVVIVVLSVTTISMSDKVEEAQLANEQL